ncbi:hypothetical protein [Celeribacter sp.]|uniref:hypothetical protein n=1 Tax=Celeribacter sp. TaxID=1890673 RepID=UPI003A95958F
MLANVILSLVCGFAIAVSLHFVGAPLWLSVIGYGLGGAIALVSLSLRGYLKTAPQSSQIDNPAHLRT